MVDFDSKKVMSNVTLGKWYEMLSPLMDLRMGYTDMSKKLFDKHGISISRDTIRNIIKEINEDYAKKFSAGPTDEDFDEAKRIGNRLRTIQENLGIDSDGEFAKVLGWSAATFSKTLRGKRAMRGKDFNSLRRFADEKGINIDWLFGGEGVSGSLPGIIQSAIEYEKKRKVPEGKYEGIITKLKLANDVLIIEYKLNNGGIVKRFYSPEREKDVSDLYEDAETLGLESVSSFLNANVCEGLIGKRVVVKVHYIEGRKRRLQRVYLTKILEEKEEKKSG